MLSIRTPGGRSSSQSDLVNSEVVGGGGKGGPRGAIGWAPLSQGRALSWLDLEKGDSSGSRAHVLRHDGGHPQPGNYGRLPALSSRCCEFLPAHTHISSVFAQATLVDFA